MKYPIEYTFTVGGSRSTPKSTIVTPSVKLSPRAKVDQVFPPGTVVTIYNISIHRAEDKSLEAVYSFRDKQTNKQIDRKFGSTAAADAYIDQLQKA